MQDNNDMAETSLTEHMEPLQTVTFTTTSNLGDNNANSSSQLMVSLYLSIIHYNVMTMLLLARKFDEFFSKISYFLF